MNQHRRAHIFIDGHRWPLSVSPKETIGARPGTKLWGAESLLIYFEDRFRGLGDPKYRKLAIEQRAVRDRVAEEEST